MKIDIQLATSIANRYYNIDGDAIKLAGEVDFNFLISTIEGEKYLLKICREDTSVTDVEFQVKLLNHINSQKLDFQIPKVIRTIDNHPYAKVESGNKRYVVRLHSWVPGRTLSVVNPRSSSLFFSWGHTCGELSSALMDFDHEGAHRFDKWNPKESLFSRQFASHIDEEYIDIANHYWDLFEEKVVPEFDILRHSVNYSDAHEHNLILDQGNGQKITGVIDFGDAIYAPTICELAIACAYAGMYQNDPLESMSQVVAGYNDKLKLEEREIETLFLLICGRLLITVASAAHNKFLEPENEYLQISDKPAKDLLLKLSKIDIDFAHYAFRVACGLDAHPDYSTFKAWLVNNESQIVSPISMEGKATCDLDLSVGSLDLGNNENFESVPNFEIRINEILSDSKAEIGVGGYGEVRPFYTTESYKKEGNNGPRWRTMHLGTDYWTRESTPVYSIWEGIVYCVQDNDNPCDYGPTIIIEHKIDDKLTFYTLYGHLSKDSLSLVSEGEQIDRGQLIATIGDGTVNGGWPPHLHFQVMLNMLGNTGDFPGVCYVSESNIWLSNSPSINPKENQNAIDSRTSDDKLLSLRKRHLGKSLSVSYNKPLHMVRGSKQFLYDVTGRRYLDTINNVAHVGHEHPRVVKAAVKQISVLNTNTRYLHDNVVDYAEQLLSKCPKELEVVYFVNSGSEANELAIRMAKTYSGQEDMIALQTGYHGNTGACVDVSSYKFDGKGGKGAPEHTTIIPMPDVYRGTYKNINTAGKDYAQYALGALSNLKQKGRNVAGIIAESIMSCGGQIVLPPGYLKEVYKMIRAEGGLCISDEVQVGFGRVGAHYWGFQLHDVIPDIVTCGKPIGNGHPLGAVITTRKVAEAFTNGMEYFNTYGGNPVSCAVGMEVLNVIEDEGLQENARAVGSYLIQELRSLQTKYPIIGDVRGIGLFCGIELVKDRNTLEPAHEEATYLVNRMRDFGILMSTDGPLHNVIKMKPPMCFTTENVGEMIRRLDTVLTEDKMRIVMM